MKLLRFRYDYILRKKIMNFIRCLIKKLFNSLRLFEFSVPTGKSDGLGALGMSREVYLPFYVQGNSIVELSAS
ncbi:hypothetical protein BCS99_11350 [Vibrio breoganii]|nr:hypothetical protein BCT77_07265 [Vibrio breoganii]PMO77628.1 hypothetical protein BCT02_07350 [Vibrio breoganii]PMO86539.1 hypothetical protein BCS99_11350 [Vibrio breoganii]